MTKTKKLPVPSKPVGRPPKEKVVKQRRRLKHIFRGISVKGLYNEALGIAPVEEIEAYVELFLNDGYELMLVQHLSREKAPETSEVMGEQMLYVLVKNV